MLIKIFYTTRSQRDNFAWINPDHIDIMQPGFSDGQWHIGFAGSEDGLYVTEAEAERILALINGTPAAPQAPAGDAPDDNPPEINHDDDPIIL